MALKKKAAAKRKMAKPMRKVKATAKKTTATKGRLGSLKKATAKGTIAFPSSPITEKQSKAQIFAELANITGLAKGDVKNLFSALKNVLERHIKGRGYGEFIIPELGVKVRRISKAATKARMGRNPFTGEEIKIAAKPARKSVKATALKALKEIATA